MTRLGVVMDPIGSMRPHKDSSFAMLLEASARGWALEYMEVGDLRLRDGRAEADCRPLSVRDQESDCCTLGDARPVPLGDLDVILMRKDPPVDVAFITATWILERAEAEGALVVNSPRALRDANEKLAATWFPQCAPPSLVTSAHAPLRAFVAAHGRAVLKPLDAMGGRGVFVLDEGDPNVNVIIEEMTRHGTRHVMAQRYLPGVVDGGDKRILLIDGEPVPEAMVRIPAAGEMRANMAVGGRVEAAALTDRDRWICQEIGPALRERGLRFVGIDVIDGHLTEVNVTSPTGIRQIDRLFGVNVAGRLLDAISRTLAAR